MVCLKCTHDNQHVGPNCTECGNWIGFVHDGRGFIPQIEYLQKDLKEGTITPEECSERFQRLEIALGTMIQHMEKGCESITNLGLDDMQQGTLAGFMAPARQGLEAMINIVAEIDPAEEWPVDTFTKLEAAQFDILRGSEGMAFLANNILQIAQQNGTNLQELAAQQAAAEAPAEHAASE